MDQKRVSFAEEEQVLPSEAQSFDLADFLSDYPPVGYEFTANPAPVDGMPSTYSNDGNADVFTFNGLYDTISSGADSTSLLATDYSNEPIYDYGYNANGNTFNVDYGFDFGLVSIPGQQTSWDSQNLYAPQPVNPAYTNSYLYDDQSLSAVPMAPMTSAAPMAPIAPMAAMPSMAHYSGSEDAPYEYTDDSDNFVGAPAAPADNLARARKHSVNLQRVKYQPEKPKRKADKPHIRINATTQGKSSRTGKINNYNPDKIYKPVGAILPTWHSGKYEFSYLSNGELEQQPLSTKELKAFIYDHPKTKDCKLRLWIQRTPADSLSRYRIDQSSECRFADCPERIANSKGTIAVGHLRVSLDEKSYKHGDNADPFHCAGFVHLYCMERFLDFPEICTLNHIEVKEDTRRLDNEPNHDFHASLLHDKQSDGQDVSLAKRFIQACQKTGRPNVQDHPNYPVSGTTQADKKDRHTDMLNYSMVEAREKSRAKAQRKVFDQRGKKPTQMCVNMGDIQMKIDYKQSTKKGSHGKRPTTKRAHDEDDSDVETPVRASKTKRARAAKSSVEVVDESGSDKEVAPAKKVSNKRQRAAESDDEEISPRTAKKTHRPSPIRTTFIPLEDANSLFMTPKKATKAKTPTSAGSTASPRRSQRATKKPQLANVDELFEDGNDSDHSLFEEGD
ncbi:hypothetical protein K490DRAFT_68324 [Saccharata proteae CBS 121410]|uniref:Uncharacterized protein n=1 Tax=Saccharata proteae CBS 121410 TaxID=1314787 RepID=A0A9P4HNF7_9PEZI|nr:hypothetical protein K490DRAFT_68324 [Saccharata proteae CBS 121410]